MHKKTFEKILVLVPGVSTQQQGSKEVASVQERRPWRAQVHPPAFYFATFHLFNKTQLSFVLFKSHDSVPPKFTVVTIFREYDPTALSICVAQPSSFLQNLIFASCLASWIVYTFIVVTNAFGLVWTVLTFLKS